ncbi:6-pyruvoyl trahydropterin synthase family protein [Burkholderia multivorans]|uniref:6-carboxy-5,6,7,8-tetrahydropterin synthase n=1 Tax=Burkholderia multivorans TaxID=87883 RepID=A0AB37ART7_9BURK|nr:6-carboxytetrahydropterin synthase [Burkholderia multivorans]PRE45528.1 6-carboxytetrahydropterin synthase QueD [Burkholderia multivorans]PRE52121.1 6-carboxytetrahydropterin synthase QueD [Burkholderia multivorans]
MLIRKLFSFEGAHVVRHASSHRCAWSIHGHSYRVEIILEADALDNGQMVYDFGLLKAEVREIVDAFDHTLVFWNCDDPAYIAMCRNHSLRWISLPVSPSAEQLSRVFFVLVDTVMRAMPMRNGEADVRVQSVIVHETATGYAQCFRRDAYNARMGLITPALIGFSDAVRREAATGILDELSSSATCAAAC